MSWITNPAGHFGSKLGLDILSSIWLFAIVDDIFCLFEGDIENVAQLKQQYGLNKTVSNVSIVIEAYRTLRDRGPYPADQVMRDIHGRFAFVLYDSTSRIVFVAADADGSVPFFRGTDSEGDIVLSDDPRLAKTGCGKSYAPFPKGCFFTSSGGLRSYEHPHNELKPVPRVDSSGQICGATFKVDEECKKKNPACKKLGVLQTGLRSIEIAIVPKEFFVLRLNQTPQYQDVEGLNFTFDLMFTHNNVVCLYETRNIN